MDLDGGVKGLGQMGFLEGAVIVFATMLKQAKIVDAVMTILRWMGSPYFFFQQVMRAHGTRIRFASPRLTCQPRSSLDGFVIVWQLEVEAEGSL